MAGRPRFVGALIGEKIELPAAALRRYPELAQAKYRRGGFPVRVAGWALGTGNAAAITLWRTIFIAPGTRLTPELLLHELRHVHQFLERRTFPFSYLCGSLSVTDIPVTHTKPTRAGTPPTGSRRSPPIRNCEVVKHTATSVVTIERFIIEQEKLHPEATGELSGLLYDLA